MAKKLGNDYRLFVGDGAGSETFTQIAGQRSLKYDRKATTIDISDKTSAPYGLKAPGNFNVQIDCEGVVDLPDTNGLSRSETLFKARTAGNYQIRKSPFSSGDIVFAASCYTLDCSPDYPKDAESTYTIQLGLAAVPTTDTLA